MRTVEIGRNPLKSGQGFNSFAIQEKGDKMKVVIPLNRVKVSTEYMMKKKTSGEISS